ncbi:hypothetical protein BDQ17DRAFT_1345341 [Cyathus striatus]|nr:hypothetical protein BDQ17DRAFT_1345341 [Cyathus striatus]
MNFSNDSERPAKRARVEEAQSAPSDSITNDQFLDEDEDEDDDTQQLPEPIRASDLYLDTINRAVLDFDFEKVCSVSLSNINIYGCLVCGKYFQGRGRKSYAYSHSIHDDHHVFINLETTKVYVLPDGYLVSDPSLEDISYVLAPSFTPSSIVNLSAPKNDHMNVIIHALLHIPPLRDHLLLSSFRSKESELLKRFAALAKKIWNPRLFKSQVSPHEFLQEVNRASAGKFRLEKQGDPVEFLGWLLNRLHLDMGGTKKKKSIVVRPDVGDNEKPQFDIARDIQTAVSPFLFLAVDLPPPPLFQDAIEKNIIHKLESTGHLKRYKCQRLPHYIILHFKRFTKSIFVEEKNPTIVNFPLRGLDFKEYKENTVWKVHLRAAGGGGENEKWFMIQDLIVEETRKEMIFLGETVLQIWERRPSKFN